MCFLLPAVGCNSTPSLQRAAVRCIRVILHVSHRALMQPYNTSNDALQVANHIITSGERTHLTAELVHPEELMSGLLSQASAQHHVHQHAPGTPSPHDPRRLLFPWRPAVQCWPLGRPSVNVCVLCHLLSSGTNGLYVVLHMILQRPQNPGACVQITAWLSAAPEAMARPCSLVTPVLSGCHRSPQSPTLPPCCLSLWTAAMGRRSTYAGQSDLAWSVEGL